MFDVVFAFGASVPSSFREETKTTLAPSGDHCGTKLPAPRAVAVVSGVRPVPSAFTRQMFCVPFAFGASVPSSFREETKTTLAPSGDHCGPKLPTPLAVAVVRGVRPVPSAFTRQMFDVKFAFGASVPSSFREETKTTLAPSGDHCGAKLSALFAVAVVSGVRPVSSAFTRQMFDVKFAFAASLPSSFREEAKTILGKLNRALTALTASMASGHAPVPEQLPDQPAKYEPATGAAVSVTLLPASNEAEQVGPQSIPA